jgi:hypothetical protein
MDRLASALEPRIDVDPRDLSHVLHVSYDLAEPIDEQIKKTKGGLIELRNYLYRYTGENPPRHRSDTLWRDVYIFLLAELLKLNDAQIGARVFPDLPRDKALKLVDQRLKVVREALSGLDPII